MLPAERHAGFARQLQHPLAERADPAAGLGKADVAIRLDCGAVGTDPPREGLHRHDPTGAQVDDRLEGRPDLSRTSLEGLLEVAFAYLRRRVERRVVERGDCDLAPELDASRVLSECRKSLVQRNANPQMVAERALFALQAGLGG